MRVIDEIKKWGIRVLFVLMVGASGYLLYGSLMPGHNWGGDFSGYITQAKSILEGTPRAYVEANRSSMEQSSWPVGPVAYPWGFPILLAPFYAVFGLNPMALKVVGVICYLLFLLVLWVGFREVHTASWFLCLVCLFALNPSLLKFSDQILSDLPFLLFSTLCISLIQKFVVQGRCVISRRLDFLLMGALIAFAFLVRTNGLLLLVTLGATQLISCFSNKSHSIQPDVTDEGYSNKFKRLGVHLVPYAVFFFLITISYWLLPDGGASHLSRLEKVTKEMFEKNLYYYFFDLPAGFFRGVPRHTLLYGATIPLAFAGAVRRYRSDYPAVIYVTLTMLLYITWPYKQGLRFLFPIFPFYISFVLSGFEAICGGRITVKRAVLKIVCFVPVIFVIYWFGTSSLDAVKKNMSRPAEIKSGPFAPTSQAVFSFITNNTNPDSVIVFFKPRVMKLMTGRQSITTNEGAKLSCADYLCLYLRTKHSQMSVGAMKTLLTKGVAEVVFENKDFRVYSLNKLR